MANHLYLIKAASVAMISFLKFWRSEISFTIDRISECISRIDLEATFEVRYIVMSFVKFILKMLDIKLEEKCICDDVPHTLL